VRFGVVLPQFGQWARGPEVRDRLGIMAVSADRLGYEVLWTADHVVFPATISTPYPYGPSLPFSVTDPVLDALATLAYVAALTPRIRLGTSVLVLPYRQPIVLAKELATLDVLSGGRLTLGVASGWLAEEFDLLGIPFRERGARTDEYLAVLRALWTEDRVTFVGRSVTVRDAVCFPKPVQRPHPPIWVGGRSRPALRRVARFGDGWLAPPPVNLEALAADVATLRRLAEGEGRDPASIGVASSGGARSIDDLVERLPALERIGVTVTGVPVLAWGRSFDHALELLAQFAERARLEARP